MTGRILASAILVAAALGAGAAAVMAQQGMPADEAAFIKAVQAAQPDYKNASGEVAKGNVRGRRKDQVCWLLDKSLLTATNWVGQVTRAERADDGTQILVVAIAPELWLGTWSNPRSDLQDRTLLASGTPLSMTAASLKIGDPVVFSAQFIPNDRDCVREMGETWDQSMMTPGYAVHFTSIAR